MLVWTDGPREKGCVYHRKARFSFPFATGQVDVFVMPRLAKARPIAITINVTTRRAGKKTLLGSLAKPSEASSLRSRLAPKLHQIGFAEERASFVNDIVAMLESEAATIKRALVEAKKTG